MKDNICVQKKTYTMNICFNEKSTLRPNDNFHSIRYFYFLTIDVDVRSHANNQVLSIQRHSIPKV